jgi:hypothetical protein
MFLILHQNDIDSLSFIKYLKINKVEHLAISMQNLINNVQIKSELKDLRRETYWNYQEKAIDFNKLTGIYNATYYPEKDYFLDFKQEDIEYARSEWHAYILYLLSNHQNCLNPISHEQFVGTHLSLLKLYKLSPKYGFSVPEHAVIYTNDQMEINTLMDQGYIFKTTTYDYVNYTKKDLIAPLLAIKTHKGAEIICHIIDDYIIAKIRYADGDCLYELNEDIKQSCFNIARDCHLRVAEILLLQTPNNDHYLYHVSPYPNWSVMGESKKYCWDKLINVLS